MLNCFLAFRAPNPKGYPRDSGQWVSLETVMPLVFRKEGDVKEILFSPLIKFVNFLAIILTLSLQISCSPQPQTLTLATTTSTADSGLLDYILPPFEKENNVKVRVIAVGSGQAIRLGERGDVDIILVHDPEREEKFINDGYGTNRQPVMYNDFVIAGPAADPAKIRGMKDAAQAFTKLAQTEGVIFVSRGDESGTHTKEKAIWRKAGIVPMPAEQRYQWAGKSKTGELRGRYQSLGQGMGETLNVANEKQAYTLSDRGTFLFQKGLRLIILVEGDEMLFNPYSIIAVNPQKHFHVKYDLAVKLINYLVAYETQKRIANFGKDKYGQSLFLPNSKEWQAKQK